MDKSESTSLKEYIGDGVYIDFNGYMLKLTTEDGINETNKIYLESEVFKRMLEYIEKLNTPVTRF